MVPFAGSERVRPIAEVAVGRESGAHQILWPANEANRSSARHFLFISMPFGPFGRELAEKLRASGAQVTRALLNAGDAFDWGLKDALTYRGPWGNWGNWLRVQLQSGKFTDIVTYGDSSPYAATALIVASELGVRCHVMEQGYFRPDWVTLEASGVNANSQLPRDPDWYRNHPAARHPADVEVVGRTTSAAVRHIVAYHVAMYLGAPVFSRFRAHYSDSAPKQAVGHVARYGLQPLRRGVDQRIYEDLVRADGPVFLCVLQRPGDSQLWRHSEYASLPAFIERAISSFAVNAPSDARLVIRPHPLDPGLLPYRSIIAKLAREHGVEDRVCLTDYGKLHDVLPRMAGVVCINSTAGLAAIEFGRPTITLGRAIYDMAGMTHQGDLDGFWKAPQAPDKDLYFAFRHVVMAETQVNGAYATQNGRRLAVPEMARRLLARV